MGEQDSDPLPHTYHPSFSDFLVDSKRCSNHNFAVIKPEMHAFIVLRCFEFMKAVLRRNILDLTHMSILNRRIPGPDPEAAYACPF